MEELERQNLQQVELTRKSRSEASLQELMDTLRLDAQKAEASLQSATNEVRVNEVKRADEKVAADQKVQVQTDIDRQEIERLRSMTDMQIGKIKAVEGNMVAALQEFGDKAFVSNLINSLGSVAAATGVTTADLFAQIFEGTPFEGAMKSLAERPLANKASGQKP